MIRVLHFVETTRRGGAERQLATILKYSQNYKHYAVSLYSSDDRYQSDKEDYFCINSKSPMGRVFQFYKLSKKLKPDVVYAWGALTYLIAVICSLFNGYRVINGSIRHGIYNNNPHALFRKSLLHLSRFVVANSKAGLRANKLKEGFVLYNGVDERFDATKFNMHRSNNPLVTLSSIANLVPIKDYGTIFNVLASLRSEGLQFSYYVMGDGPLRSEYESLVAKLGIQDCVFFLGSIPSPEEYLAKTDIFIHSSRGEGCPNAVLEAMFMGLPVVATDTGGTSEVIEDNGILFPLGDENKLANAIRFLADNCAMRERMGCRSYQIVCEKFSVNRMIDNYERIIEVVYSNNVDLVRDMQGANV